MEIPDDGVFSRVERVYLPKWKSTLQGLITIFTNSPIQNGFYRSASFKRIFLEMDKKNDLCIGHLIRTADYLKLSNKKKILEATDSIALNYNRVKSNPEVKGLWKYIYSLEQPRVLRYEKRVYPNFDKTVLVSNHDCEYLQSRGASTANIEVISNGIDTTQFSDHSRQQRQSNPYVIVFIGNLESLQNYDAACYFAEQVMPELVKLRDVRFRIVGKIPDKKAAHLRQIKNIEVTGLVDSISDACKGALVGVCPMRIGAGIQNKNLEYMAMGIPCITTTLGYEGIPATPTEDLIVADTTQEFIEEIVNFIDNPEIALKIGRSGKNVVSKYMSWDKILARYNELVAELLK